MLDLKARHEVGRVCHVIVEQRPNQGDVEARFVHCLHDDQEIVEGRPVRVEVALDARGIVGRDQQWRGTI